MKEDLDELMNESKVLEEKNSQLDKNLEELKMKKGISITSKSKLKEWFLKF